MRKLEVMKMKCLRQDRRNDKIRAEAKVAPAEEKFKENRLQLFGHICIKAENDLVMI